MPPMMAAVKKVVAAMMAEALMAEVMASTVVAAAMMTTTAAAVGVSGDWRDRRRSSDCEREQEGRSKRSAQCAIDTGHGVLQGCVA